MFKVYSAAVAAGAANGVENEIFIPLTSLLGSYPLTDADANVRYAQGLLMFAEKLFSVMSPSGFMKLGQTVSKSSNGSNGFYTLAFSLSTTMIATSNINGGFAYAQVLPVPTVGTNDGVGGYAFIDIFAGAVKVPALGAIPSAGVSFVAADLEQYGVPVYASIDLSQDSRQLVAAGMFDIANNQDVRATSVLSAIITSSLSSPSNFSITTQSINIVDGTIGLDESELDNYLAATRTASFSIQTSLSAVQNNYNVVVA